MTITEVIDTLQAIKATHGDIDVLILNYEFQTILELDVNDFCIRTECEEKYLLIEQ